MNQSRSRRHLLWMAGGVAVGAAVTTWLVLALVSVWESRDPVREALAPPRFVDETAQAGIEHRYDGEFEYFVGGGVAVFDCDGDGMPDLYFAGGENHASLFRNESPVGGALRFAEVDDPAARLTGVTGAYPVDVDADGVIDLVVLRRGENVLLRGLGGCRFERANEMWGIDGGDDWTVAFAATWEGNETLPTLVFGNYLAPAATLECADHQLFRPQGDRYGEALPLSPGWCTLSALFSDWDRSGRRDLRMTNDRHYYLDGEEQLWRVEEGQRPRLYSAEEGWQTVRIWGMGIASHDLTGDGNPEVFLTSQGDNKLQTLVGGPSRPHYEDIALARGVTAHRPFTGDVAKPSTAWHAEFQDVNNDGLIDLYVSKGNVEAMPEYAEQDPNNLLLGMPDGTFVEAADRSGILTFENTRGAALVDLNLNGMLDLVEVNRRTNVTIWRNVGWGSAGEREEMGNWVSVALRQPGHNIWAVGAWVEVRSGSRRWEKEVTVGGGHAGGQLGWIHFGLGTADRVSIRVHWPDGEAGPWLETEANRFVVIESGRDQVSVWAPRSPGSS